MPHGKSLPLVGRDLGRGLPLLLPRKPAGQPHEAFAKLRAEVNTVVHDLVAAFGGSISAEHGLGVLRRDEAARYKAPVEIALMRAVKQAIDPHGLMNPGKVLAP